MAMRAVPLVGGPVELRGALDLETTPSGVMPRRLPAWTKEQYQDPSVYGVTVMPSGVRLVFRTDARALEELVVDGALAGRRQAPVGNVLRMAGPGAVQRLIPGKPGPRCWIPMVSCPALEQVPGPTATGPDGRIAALGDPAELLPMPSRPTVPSAPDPRLEGRTSSARHSRDHPAPLG